MSIQLAGLEPPVRICLEHPISAEDFWRVSQQNRDVRLERSAQGELLIMSPTGFEGGAMEGDVFGELRNWALQDNRGKACGPNTGFTLSDTSVRAADASWVSWEKVNILSDKDRKRFAHVCPEFVIEVCSESDSLVYLRRKMDEWLANGCELAWLIDPQRKAVEIYRPAAEPEVQEGHSAVYGEGPVAGFILELNRIWS